PQSPRTRIDHLAVSPDRPRTAAAFTRHCVMAFAPPVIAANEHARQSTLAPDALTTSAHFGISDFTYARSSSGVPPTTSMPGSVKALRTGGSLPVAAAARCSVAMTFLRRPRRRHERMPGRRLEAGKSRLGDGRDLGQHRRPLERRDRERAD